MKPAQSDLILSFLLNVDKGLITGKDNSSGPGTLERTAVALREILDGAEPDKALEISRTGGTPPASITPALAYKIHEWRSADEKWVVIEKLASEWLAENGRDPLTASRLKKIHKKHLESLQRFDGIKRMQSLTEKMNEK
jgi:hypothetical protein